MPVKISYSLLGIWTSYVTDNIWNGHADGLDEAAMERADHGPAASEVSVRKEAVALPLQVQKGVQDRDPHEHGFGVTDS
jgi:hypothetical protein